MKMTLKIVAASVAASFVLLSGCGGKKDVAAAASEEVVPEHDFVSEVVIPAAAQQAKEKNEASTTGAVMLWKPNGALWLENDEGIMVWGKVDIPAGTALTAVLDSDGKVVQKKAKRKSGSSIEEREFYRIKYGERDDYWAQTGMLAVNATVGVVIADDTLIYNTPMITGMGSTVIPAGTIVAVLEDESLDKAFVKIDANLSDYIDVRSKYIKADKIVTSADDVQVLQLINLAKKAKNDAVRNELLVNAKTLSPSDAVKNMLEAYENELNAASAPKTFTKESVDGFYVRVSSNGDMMNIRKEPGTAGDVAFKVADQAVLSVDGKTAESDEIDGKSAVWYHVREMKNDGSDEEPIWNLTDNEGWIFAGFVENYQMFE